MRNQTILAALAAVTLLFAAPAWATEPWDAPFTGEPAEMLAAAEALDPPEDANWDLLLQEQTLTLDDAGLATRTWRYVWRVVAPEGVNAGSIQTGWSPWYQARPEIRVRVILPDGTVREPGADTFVEAAEGSEGDAIYSDRMVLEAPYPGLEVGAVVEEEYLVREERPYFAAGALHQLNLEPNSRGRLVRVALDVPKSLPVKVKTRSLQDVKPRRTTAAGRVRTEWALRDIEQSDWQPSLPRDTSNWRMITVSTGRSWKDIARSYSDLVDARLTESADLVAELTPMAKELVADAADDWSRADRLLGWVHDTVRYTGLEFGEASLRPVAPTTVMERGYGDCKDQSTLLVGLLRAVGLDAHVTLLQVGSNRDIDPDLPGMGGFDHAIVHVRADGGDLFLDPTLAGALAGQLTDSEFDRHVLIASPRTRGLTRIPPQTTDDARVRYTTEYRLGDGVPGSTRYLNHFYGSAELGHRLDPGFPTELSDRWQGWLAENHPDGSVTATVEIDDARSRDPLVIDSLVTGLDGTAIDPNSLSLDLDLAEPLEDLPGIFRRPAPEEAPARKADAALISPIDEEVVERLFMPPGFVVVDPPTDFEEDLLLGTYTARFGIAEDGAFEARLRFVAPAQRIARDELPAIQERVAAFLARPTPRLFIEHASIGLTERGDLDGALAASRSPEGDARTLARRADVLLAAGLVDEAIAAAEQATELAPDDTRPWLSLALARIKDRFGLVSGEPVDLQGAREAAARAYALDPDLPWAKEVQADLLLFGDDARKFGPGSDLAAAAALYGELVDDGLPSYRSNQYAALGFGGGLDTLAALLPELPTTDQERILILLCTAATQPPEAVERQARSWRLSEAALAEQLFGVPMLLLRHGLFEQTVAMYDFLQDKYGTDPTVRKLVDAITAGSAPEPIPPRKPEAVVLEALVRSFEGQELDASILAPEALAVADLAALREHLQPVDPKEEFSTIGPKGHLVLLRGSVEFEVEGDKKTGWRVTAVTKATLDVPFERTFFVVHTKEGPRILGEREVLMVPLLDRIETDLDAGRLGPARKVLEGFGAPVDHIEEAMESLDEPDALRLRWLTLRNAEEPPRLELVDELAALLSELPEDPRDRSKRGQYMTAITMLREEAEPVVPWVRLVLERPKSVSASQLGMMIGLVARVDGPEAAEELLTESTGHLTRWDVQKARREMTLTTGDMDGALAIARELAESSDTDSNLNVAAWYAVLAGQVDDLALRQVQESIRKTPGESAPIIHTLASVLAELDRPVEAIGSLQRSAMAQGKSFEPVDAYVVARIAQGLGEIDAAVKLYVEAAEDSSMVGSWIHKPARAHLEALAAQGSATAKAALDAIPQ